MSSLDIETQENYAGKYRPNKKQRIARRKVYERYYDLRDCDPRKDAEAEWEIADKEYRMYFSEPSEGDWRADIHLPDAFAAIQVQSQETIERRSRPALQGVEESDEPLEDLANATINYNMDVTGYDYQFYLGKLSASIRGHAFLREYWREEKRKVQMPVKIGKEGGLEYEEKELTDYDDTVTEVVPNEYVYPDEKALCDEDMEDYVRREIITLDKFHDMYDDKPGFFDTKYVVSGGETTTKSFFKMPKDMNETDVEVLHYQNKRTDTYRVTANNVLIHDGPLPSPHKELDITSVKHYEVPGRFYGLGVPKVIHYLSEERRTIRNLNLDRQKLIVSGVFLHNAAFDLDDEDATVYPGKFIDVDTQGQPISQAVQQVNFGDVGNSYFKTEDILRDDTIRATGIDDRMQGVNIGSTATEAAILKESSLKRVNMIAGIQEMTTVRRVGKLKWANIKFFYPIPRIEKITQDNEEKEKKTYRKITVNNKKFEVVIDNGRRALKMSDVNGASAFELKGDKKSFLEKDYDIVMNAEAYTPPSKAIEQTKKTELFSVILNNPATLGAIDINAALADVLKVNDIKPDKWLNQSRGRRDMQMLAENENQVMLSGVPLDGTEGANEDHTLMHIMFTQTMEFKEAPEVVKKIISNHILEEHDKNPATGAAADLLQQHGLSAGQLSAQQQPVEGMKTPFNLAPQTTQPQPQVADLQPTNYSG